MTPLPAAEALREMEQLPLAMIDTVAPGTSLVLAPHPDDESLGCGGLIALSCMQGRPPVIVCVTDGSASHPGSAAYPPSRLVPLRQAELRSAAQHLGVSPHRTHFLGLPDARAPVQGPAFDAAADRVAGLVRSHAVTTVFAAWRFDSHCDHEATATLAEEVARRTGVRLMFYPVWGWLLPPEQMLPLGKISGVRLDISSVLVQKQSAVAAHASQYTGLIADDPGGFRLPSALLAVFQRPVEVFLNA